MNLRDPGEIEAIRASWMPMAGYPSFIRTRDLVMGFLISAADGLVIQYNQAIWAFFAAVPLWLKIALFPAFGVLAAFGFIGLLAFMISLFCLLSGELDHDTFGE
jgi:hypothetical protein